MRHLPTVLLLSLPACGGASRADEDGDGFSPAQGDCDDTDPAVNPDATEVPYDNVDQDCDPDNDGRLVFTALLDVEGLTGPAGPRFAADGDLVMTSTVWTGGGLDGSTWTGHPFDAGTAAPLAVRTEVLEGGDPAIELGPVVDAVLRGEDTYLATSVVTGAGDLRATALQLPAAGGWIWSGYGPSGVTEHFEDVAIGDSDGALDVAACGSSAIYWLSGTPTTFQSGTFEHARATVSASRCEVQGAEVRALDADGTVTAWDASADPMVAGETWSGVVDLAWEPEGMLLARADGLRWVGAGDPVDQVTAEPPVQIRADVSPDGVLFAVYATGAGDLYLVHGPPEGPWAEVALGAGLATDDLDVEATEDALFVGARSDDLVRLATTRRP
ncbi:MAG: putative metal-binding motif-containing protein [Myxococcales bacterium]|nr:putative metal-binding motif-containing protein [Myxococcales bacterium]